MKLIDKSAIVAEIARLQSITMDEDGNFYTAKAQAEYNVLCMLDSFLDTLEVKEVDLKNELKEDWLFADKIEVDCLESMCLTEDMFASLAKKYFELGINTRKI